MRVRAIDDNRDWEFGKGRQSYKIDEQCIAQMIKTRILSFLGDCFFATDKGIDWFNLLDRGFQNEVRLERSIKQTILDTEGVVGINSFDLMRNGRQLVVSYDVQTIFSASYQAQLEVE